MNQAIVSVAELHIQYKDKTVIENLNVTIENGEFVYLIGKTGSGKSSILRTLYADLAFEEGQVLVAGYDLKKIKKSELPYFRRKIGIVFQDFQLFADRSVAENLYFVMQATGWTDHEKMRKRLNLALSQVSLDGVQLKKPHQLSGGEQQRVAIARALLNDPILLFADEPTGNLDPTVAAEILDLFVRINRTGTAVVMATHNHSFLRKHPARVLLCENSAISDFSREQVVKKVF